MKLKLFAVLLCMTMVVSFGACGSNESASINDKEESATEEMDETTEEEKEEEPTTFTFVDAFEETYEVELNPDVKRHNYDFSYLTSNEEGGPVSGSNHKIRTEFLSYEDGTYTSRIGIDVSYHQGTIDWEKVKAAGIEFAFIRIGYRGYGQEGNIKEDEMAMSYLSEAKAVGLDVGVYFYSQAINEEEAKEEAEFVLSKLNGMELELPVVYDPEHVLDADARTDNVTGEQFTKNAIVFTETVEAAGYTPAIYANMKWEAYELDLSQLSCDIWYADYEAIPQTPYDFRFWQYSSTASVDGISGDVDLNIEFLN